MTAAPSTPLPRRLVGRSAIVTGAASGIGRATAWRLAGEGASVVVADQNGPGAEEVAAALVADGLTAVAVEVDVAEEEQIRHMVATAVDAFGGLDILHNNAAGTGADLVGQDKDILSMTVEHWDRTMAVNLRGPALGCKHAIPRMLERGGGSIINTSSVSGVTGDLVYTAYGASKGGVNTLTQSIATQFGVHGIRCNAVLPGLVITPQAREHLPADMREIYEVNHLTRLGVPDDVAAAVAFLASDDSAFITGALIPVEGGQTAHIATYGHFRERGWNAVNP